MSNKGAWAAECNCGFNLGGPGLPIPKWLESSVTLYSKREGYSIMEILTNPSTRVRMREKTRQELERVLNSSLRGVGSKGRGQLSYPEYNECPVHPRKLRVDFGPATTNGGSRQ
jgi:hypothetical protein